MLAPRRLGNPPGVPRSFSATLPTHADKTHIHIRKWAFTHTSLLKRPRLICPRRNRPRRKLPRPETPWIKTKENLPLRPQTIRSGAKKSRLYLMTPPPRTRLVRSEERRVGKEGRDGWAA